MEEKRLSDYRKLDFSIASTDLEFDIQDNFVLVRSQLQFKRDNKNERSLFLDGRDLKLNWLKLDGEDYSDYEETGEGLRLFVDKDEFLLETEVRIDPYKNLSCEGLYKSGDILCTQNEAEGFRKITYYFDRPDCMSIFKTKLVADKSKFPILLSNGDLIESGDLDGGRHYTCWSDPHKKPSYLYAVVAGDLALVQDQFTTASGRVVDLKIYVDHGNEDRCEHAMNSLKNSMRWDEEKFGLEYDLDTYMIVAVDSFNMGAMENKGLNIFNSEYVLAKKETATDANFQAVEAVIGHEYFHNWTGNRVTCRDWFQLTLKEGLTVYRDQEFSSDMLSRAVKRIEDVKTLRSHQFQEDASPLSHPIKPKTYIEMNNFYTATVYEKGAEVIRMIERLIGKDGFRKGMDLYFERHDGEAVTTEDFVQAMSDANDYDFEQFKVWYDQNGTPVVKVSESYSEGVYTLTLRQSAKLNNKNYDALYIPLEIALFDTKGHKMKSELLCFKDKEQTWTYKSSEKPILSINRGFTAPVIVEFDRSLDELSFLTQFDDDEFNRYEACNLIYKDAIEKLRSDSEADVSNVLKTFSRILQDERLDSAYKAYALGIPAYQDIVATQKEYDVEGTFDACLKLKKFIAGSLSAELLSYYEQISAQAREGLSPEAMGERALKNLLLSFISYLPEGKKVLEKQYFEATNMTDELASFKHLNWAYSDKVSKESFFKKWEKDTLVMQKWFAIQASHPQITRSELTELEKSSAFNIKVPNLARSLMGQFILGNLIATSKREGFEYACEKILELDKINPQVASRLTKGLSFISKLPKEKLEELKPIWSNFSGQSLSKDVSEIANSITNSI